MVGVSSIPGAGDGVWTTKTIKKDSLFGPYEGVFRKKTEDGSTNYSWEVRITDRICSMKFRELSISHFSWYCWVFYIIQKKKNPAQPTRDSEIYFPLFHESAKDTRWLKIYQYQNSLKICQIGENERVNRGLSREVLSRRWLTIEIFFSISHLYYILQQGKTIFGSFSDGCFSGWVRKSIVSHSKL